MQRNLKKLIFGVMAAGLTACVDKSEMIVLDTQNALIVTTNHVPLKKFKKTKRNAKQIRETKLAYNQKGEIDKDKSVVVLADTTRYSTAMQPTASPKRLTY